MPSTFRGLNVDRALSPIDPERHAVLRALVLYVAHNDGFAPEPYELAFAASMPEDEVEAHLEALVADGLARFSGAHWWPTTRNMTVPPVAARVAQRPAA